MIAALDALRQHDLAVQLLEHDVELVDLAGVERKLVQCERDLVRIQLPRLASGLEKLPSLVRIENAPGRPNTCYRLLPCAQLGSPSPRLTVAADRVLVNVRFL